jgi:ABC-type transport system involved in multi-copper enzyme maturation permease subunit
MDLPAAITTVRLLTLDTLRQAVASWVFWVLLACTGVAGLFSLSVSVSHTPLLPTGPADVELRLPPGEAARVGPEKARREGIDVVAGQVSFLFGAVRAPFAQYPDEAIRALQLVLVGGFADTLGLLVTLVWTAEFLPGFLDPRSVSVLLAKPVPRWGLLAGKAAGVLAFVTVQAALFVGVTWLALGLRTGVWDFRYLMAVPLLVLHFTVFFGGSVFLAVLTRGTVASMAGVLLFWAACWLVNYARLAGAGGVAEAAYWLLPKPIDLGLMLFDALGAEKFFSRAPELAAVRPGQGFIAEVSVLTSLAASAALFAAGVVRFERADY